MFNVTPFKALALRLGHAVVLSRLALGEPRRKIQASTQDDPVYPA